MLAIHRSLTALLAPVLLLATSGCAHLTVKQDLSDEVLEVRTNRETLEAEWQAIEGRMASLESELSAFGDMQIQHEEVDTEALRGAIEITEETTVEDASNSAEEIEARAVAYKQSLEGLDDQARDEVERIRMTGQTLRQELLVGLPDAIKAITMEAGNVAIDLASVKAAADQLNDVADQNPFMTAEDRAAFDRDHAALDGEVESLRSLVDRITTSSAEYSPRLTAAATQFEQHLDSIAATD